jgi:cytochrome c oxidase subunit 2
LEGSNLVFESHLTNDDMFDIYGSKRLLTVDRHLILVSHVPTKFFITSADVLHSFAVPSMGIKVDAVPGRINTFYLVGSRLVFFMVNVLNYVDLAMDLCR